MAKVLVADDLPLIRELASLALAEQGHTIIEATNGDEAWRLLLEHRPDVALLDLRMPGPDGLELARRIRSHPDLAGTRVILLTGSGESDVGDAARAAGISQTVVKPFGIVALRDAVQRALQNGEAA
jgi:CheY-like chemotaxis protein